MPEPRPDGTGGLTFTRLGGPGDGTDADELLLLGPSLGTGVATLWEGCLPDLAVGREVVGWDLPGHGRGLATAAPFTVQDLADAVRDFATEQAGERRVRYAGVSVGGAVGLALALAPGPVADVVTLASAPKIGEPDGWTDRAELVRRGGTSAVVEGSAKRWFAPGFIEAHPEVASRLLDELTEVDDESYALVCEALARWDVREAMPDVAVPLLMVAGAHDSVVTPDTVREAAMNARARAMVLDGVAHLPPAEDPAAVASLIEEMT